MTFSSSGHFRKSLARHGPPLPWQSWGGADATAIFGDEPGGSELGLLVCPHRGREKDVIGRQPGFSLRKATSKKHA